MGGLRTIWIKCRYRIWCTLSIANSNWSLTWWKEHTLDVMQLKHYHDSSQVELAPQTWPERYQSHVALNQIHCTDNQIRTRQGLELTLFAWNCERLSKMVMYPFLGSSSIQKQYTCQLHKMQPWRHFSKRGLEILNVVPPHEASDTLLYCTLTIAIKCW